MQPHGKQILLGEQAAVCPLFHGFLPFLALKSLDSRPKVC